MALVSALAGVSGCRSADAMRQRCIAGDLGDCEGACKKGIAGEGGCFHAAELHRERAALDFKSKAFASAVTYFGRSCDGGYADGCLFSAQMIEAPFAGVVDDVASTEMPKLVGDAELEARDARLSRACALGQASGCKRYGDALVGKNEKGATAAYEKACKAGSEAGACITARTQESATFSRLAASCKHGVADDCTRLGFLLFAVDPPRAMRLFASECELRGVATLEGSAGRFVRKRAREASRSYATAPPDETEVPGAPAFDVTVEKVDGKLALVEADRALKKRAPVLGRCAADTPKATGEAKMKLTVDLTGDVYRAELVSGTLPAGVSACVGTLLESVTFEPMRELATLDVVVRLPAPP